MSCKSCFLRKQRCVPHLMHLVACCRVVIGGGLECAGRVDILPRFATPVSSRHLTQPTRYTLIYYLVQVARRDDRIVELEQTLTAQSQHNSALQRQLEALQTRLQGAAV